MADLIDRQAAIDAIKTWGLIDGLSEGQAIEILADAEKLPSAQPQYGELTPEEAASEIASGSVMPTLHWFDIMIRLKQMGYVICRKK